MKPLICLIVAVTSIHCFAASVCFPSNDRAASPALTADSLLVRELDSLRAKYQLVGLSIVVVRGDSLCLTYSAGSRDVKRRLPMEVNTRYRVASISKLVAATALMQLCEQGLVDLDADISTYLSMRVRNPNFPDTPISFVQILTHTSSLRDCAESVKFIKASYASPKKPPAFQEVLIPGGTYYSKDMWSDRYGPGDSLGWSYCNFATILTATVVEKLSGQHYEGYCREHIFGPLGMEVSFFPQELEDLEQLAVLYELDSLQRPFATRDDYGEKAPPAVDWRSAPVGVNAALYAPQAGLRCSALDLARLMYTFMHRGRYGVTALLRPETVDCMLSRHWEGQGKFYCMEGLQFQITEDLVPGQRLTGHIGFDYGFRGDMFFSAENQVGMVWMTNGGNYPPEEYHIIDPELDFFGLVMRRFGAHAGQIPGGK